ncbi:MAG: hypothetical protein ACI9J2_002028 [Saprospiraceae bacterium]|jgi:hypothetical protein
MIRPNNIQSSAAWYGPDMVAKPEQWRWELSSEESALLLAVARSFIASEEALENISSVNFSLNSLNDKLNAFRLELIEGRGFGLISGLSVEGLTKQELAVIFMGVGAHIGNARSQNAAGHLLGHVRDANKDALDPNVRIYQTSSRQTFHTDSADVVGLICIKPAKSGGESLLVSSETIYNEIQKTQPDLVDYLFDAIATDKRGEIEEGSQPFFSIPVFSWLKGKLTAIYQRQYIESAQRFAEAPRLTPKHVEALDLFDQIANDPANHFSMRLQSGDMQFVHNHNLLHDRTRFEDWPQPQDRRHLLRLWLSVPKARELPPVFAQRFGSTEVGNRGGVICKDGHLHVPPLD